MLLHGGRGERAARMPSVVSTVAVRALRASISTACVSGWRARQLTGGSCVAFSVLLADQRRLHARQRAALLDRREVERNAAAVLTWCHGACGPPY